MIAGTGLAQRTEMRRGGNVANLVLKSRILKSIVKIIELACITTIELNVHGRLLQTRRFVKMPKIFKLLSTKRGPLYLKTQSVPRCKQFSSRL
jgi:hypothetical protein